LALLLPSPLRSSFSFHTPPPTLISPLSLHDALPICLAPGRDEALAAVEHVAVAVAHGQGGLVGRVRARLRLGEREAAVGVARGRSEEHTSELQSLTNLLRPLLLPQKKTIHTPDRPPT